MTEASNNVVSAIRFVIFSFLILLNSLLVIRVLGSNDADFRVFYSTGVMIREGDGARIYQIEAQSRVQSRFSEAPTLQFNHPAYEGLLFLPFAFLSFKAATVAWVLLNIGFLAISCVVLRINGIVFLLFAPIAFTLALGQDALVLTAIIALALRLQSDGREDLSGALLALGLFRFHVILPMVALLVAGGRTRLVKGFLAGGVLVTLLSVWVSGSTGFADYVRMMTHLAQGTGSNDVLLANMTTIRGLTEFVVGAWLKGTSARTSVVIAIWASVSAVVIWRSWPALRRDPRLAIVVSLLVAPYGYAYELAPVALLAQERMSWPFLVLAFTPAYVFLGGYAAVSLMAVPLAALLVTGKGSRIFQLPSFSKAGRE